MLRDTYYDHPTQKPLQLIRALIPRGASTILDPFMGSGTTLLAAQERGISAIGIDIEETYCKMAVERLQQQSFVFGEVR
jgi:DNA modification methylase